MKISHIFKKFIEKRNSKNNSVTIVFISFTKLARFSYLLLYAVCCKIPFWLKSKNLALNYN